MKLAILLYGLEQENDRLNLVLKKLQGQLNALGPKKVDIVYRINEEESIDEKRNWLLSQTTCKKYIFVTVNSIVGENFTIIRYNAVKSNKTTPELLKLGIYSK